MSVVLRVPPVALKANSTFEQRGKSGEEVPTGACNEGDGSQAPAALRELMMRLVSNPSVPEQVIGKRDCKNVGSREGQFWNL